MSTKILMAAGLMCSVVFLTLAPETRSMAQTAEELAAQYRRDTMEQALQTREHYNLYGLHFEFDKATIQPASKSLLDDIATAMKNFPDWRLRIVGHTDSTGDPAVNKRLSMERASAVKAALTERGVADQRLDTAGLGETQPVASNDTPTGRALNRRVELVRMTDSAEAKKMLKAMSDYLAAQQSISFGFNSVLEVITGGDQKLGLASSGTMTLTRPDKVRVARSGGFADIEILFNGKTLTLLGKNDNIYVQADAQGTVDQLIDQLGDKYNRPLPAADLLLTNAYSELMQDVYDSKDLGSGVINGVECDSVAFRKDDVDLQIWIAQGNRPYPCRFVVTSRRMNGAPQYIMQFRDWRTGADVATVDYSFTAPANARKIELTEIKDKVATSRKISRLEANDYVKDIWAYNVRCNLRVARDGSRGAPFNSRGSRLCLDGRRSRRTATDAGQCRRGSTAVDEALRSREFYYC